MLTITETSNVYDCRGLEADKEALVGKITNGSTFFAIDTDTVYIYNKDAEAWVEI